MCRNWGGCVVRAASPPRRTPIVSSRRAVLRRAIRSASSALRAIQWAVSTHTIIKVTPFKSLCALCSEAQSPVERINVASAAGPLFCALHSL